MNGAEVDFWSHVARRLSRAVFELGLVERP